MPGSQSLGPAAKRYSQLQSIRDPYLRAAYDSARLTIPSLFPEPSDAQDSDRNRKELEVPWQELGARATNNVSSKLLLSLFPPSHPILKYQVEPSIAAAARESEGSNDEMTKVQKGLGQREIELTELIEADGIRSSLHEGLRQLVVAGNVLIRKPDDDEGGLRVFRLNRYVCKRNPRGKVLEIIVKESLDRGTLEEDLMEIVNEHDPRQDTDEVLEGHENEVDLYTHIKLQPNKKQFDVYQEIVGQEVPESRGTTPADAPEWICLRLIKADGEDYGRGMVEEYSGGLKSFDGLRRSMLTIAANAADIVHLVNPNGRTKVSDLQKANSGDYVAGFKADIESHTIDKNADMAIAFQMSESVEASLSFAFLLNSALRRNAERVTAEEIKAVVRELEDTFGGIYTVLAQDLQLPLVKRYERLAEKNKQLRPIPEFEGKPMARPIIVTGLEAIGRSHDQDKIEDFIDFASRYAALDPTVANHLPTNVILTRAATNIGVAVDSVVRDKDEVEAELAAQQQQAAQAELASKAIGPGISALSQSQQGEQI